MMRSHHLRTVLRRRVLLAAGLPRPVLRSTVSPAASTPVHQQARTFKFPSLFKKKPTWNPDAPPGLPTLSKLVKHLDEKIGSAPTRLQLLRSLHNYVNAQWNQTLSDDEVYILDRTYTYLRDLWLEDPEAAKADKDAVARKETTLVRLDRNGEEYKPRDFVVPEKTLGKMLLLLKQGYPKQLSLLRKVLGDLTRIEGYVPDDLELFPFVTALCNAGELEEALDVVRQWSPRLRKANEAWKLWETVLVGMTKKGDEERVLKLVKEIQPMLSGKARREKRVDTIMISYYCEKNNIAKAKEWYEKALSGEGVSVITLATVAKTALRNDQLEWAKELLQVLLERVEEGQNKESRKEAWDTAIQLSAHLYENPDTTLELLSRMQARAEADAVDPPDAVTIESLLSSAVPIRNKALVTSSLTFMSANSISPTIPILEHLIIHHVNNADVDAAIDVFSELKFTQDIPKRYAAESSQTLLQFLCSQENPNLELISDLYSDLQTWQVRLTLPSVLALLKAFLTGPYFSDIKTLIVRHAGLFTKDEKYQIINLLTDYIHSPTTSVEAAYDTYLHLARLLPAITVRDREKIMNLFFELGQPLMASKVLVDMSLTPSRLPTKYQYTAAFIGIAHTRNIQALMEVQRTMNMDPRLEPDTYLRNAHMQACNMCGLPLKALYIYSEIAESKEGPDSATISIFFDVCARDELGGLNRARSMWENCVSREMPLSENNVAAYVECLARHRQWHEGWDVVKTLEEKIGMRPGEKILSTLFKTYRRDQLRPVEKWCEETYPDVWSKVRQEMNSAALEAEVGEGDLLPWDMMQGGEVRPVFDEGLADRIREKWKK